MMQRIFERVAKKNTSARQVSNDAVVGGREFTTVPAVGGRYGITKADISTCAGSISFPQVGAIVT